jgi:hypothetical protein
MSRYHAVNSAHCVGLEIDADDDGIKSAYRKMAKQYHPDGSISFGLSILLRNPVKVYARFVEILLALSMFFFFIASSV